MKLRLLELKIIVMYPLISLMILGGFSFNVSAQSALVLNPKFLGPNALPIPEALNGKLPLKNSFTQSLQAHFTQGSQTLNLKNDLYVKLFSPKVALNISIVPLEYFNTDSVVYRNRNVTREENRKYAGGDFYLGTLIQVVENHRFLPNMVLGIHLKTASGTNQDLARFTDTPGYYFDLALGKEVFKTKALSINVHAVVGAYIWQLEGKYKGQNDALLYGLGCAVKSKNYTSTLQLGGLYGYLGDGDRPVVLRWKHDYNLNDSWRISGQIQHGNNNYPFTSFTLGINWLFPDVLK